MNCDDFRKSLDEMADNKELTGRPELPPEMVSHLDNCAECGKLLADAVIVQEYLTNMKRDSIPGDLYWSLIQTSKRRDLYQMNVFIKGIAISTIKILAPVLVLWITTLFWLPTARLFADMAIYVFGLTLLFEKLGRRLITDHV